MYYQIEDVWMAKCDKCGRTQRARMSSGYNSPFAHVEPSPLPPKGWSVRGTPRCLICDACWEAMSKKGCETFLAQFGVRKEGQDYAKASVDSGM